MTDESASAGLQVDALDSVVEAFIEWAGGPSEVSLLYTPDVLLVVETATRRGFLLDEVHFATAWADRGRVELEVSLAAALESAHEVAPTSGGIEPNPLDLIRGALKHGRPLG